MLNARARIVLALALAAGIPALIAAQQRGRGRQSLSRRRQPGRIAPADAAAHAPVHAGCLHRVRDSQAGQRRVPDQVPAGRNQGRRHRAGQRHPRRQRRVGRRGLRSAHRQAAHLHLSAGGQRSGQPRDSRQAADSGAAGRRRPRPHLQDLQGSPHLHDARRRRGLGAQPERLPAGRAAAEGVRLHLLERRGAAHDDRPAVS